MAIKKLIKYETSYSTSVEIYITDDETLCIETLDDDGSSTVLFNKEEIHLLNDFTAEFNKMVKEFNK